MNKILPWLSSQQGKLVTRTCVGLSGLAIFTGHFVWHGPLQDKIQNLSQIYRYGKPKPLSDYLENLVKTVLHDSKLEDKPKSRLRFYNVVGLELFHLGGTNYPFGALVGLPFHFEETGKIDFGDLRLEGHEQVDWLLEGDDLLFALNLSDNAKKFGIMREIHSCDIWNVVDNACLSAGFFLFAAEFIRRCNQKLKFMEKMRLKTRVAFYSGTYLMAFMFYKLFKDPMKHLKDKQCDRMAADTSPEYLDGGIEFYEKEILRNKVLRKLLGERGKKLFDKDGNEEYFLFMPKMPVRKKLEFLRELKAERTVLETA